MSCRESATWTLFSGRWHRRCDWLPSADQWQRTDIITWVGASAPSVAWMESEQQRGRRCWRCHNRAATLRYSSLSLRRRFTVTCDDSSVVRCDISAALEIWIWCCLCGDVTALQVADGSRRAGELSGDRHRMSTSDWSAGATKNEHLL